MAPANILLAMAPRAVAEQVVALKSMEDTIEDAAGDSPLCRALVEHVLARGTFAHWERLAANEATPDPVLERLLEKTNSRTILHAILERELVAPEVLRRVYAVVPRDRRLRGWIVKRAQDDPMTALDALRHTADDMAWMLKTLRAVTPHLDTSERIAADVMVAEISGVEAVWALELDRTGALDSMAAHVRASMAAGDAEPLVQAAAADPIEADGADADGPAELSFDPSREESDLDDPLRRPLEELIRGRLDGRVDRWLRLAERLRARPDATDEELISEFDPL